MFDVYNRQFEVSKLKNKKYLCGTNTLPYKIDIRSKLEISILVSLLYALP